MCTTPPRHPWSPATASLGGLHLNHPLTLEAFRPCGSLQPRRLFPGQLTPPTHLSHILNILKYAHMFTDVVIILMSILPLCWQLQNSMSVPVLFITVTQKPSERGLGI